MRNHRQTHQARTAPNAIPTATSEKWCAETQMRAHPTKAAPGIASQPKRRKQKKVAKANPAAVVVCPDGNELYGLRPISHWSLCFGPNQPCSILLFGRALPVIERGMFTAIPAIAVAARIISQRRCQSGFCKNRLISQPIAPMQNNHCGSLYLLTNFPRLICPVVPSRLTNSRTGASAANAKPSNKIPRVTKVATRIGCNRGVVELPGSVGSLLDWSVDTVSQ